MGRRFCIKIFLWVGSGKPPSQPNCRVPTYLVYFSISPSMDIFHKFFFYLKSPYRLKAISGTLIMTVNYNNLDFIFILLFAGGLKATAKRIVVSVDF